MSKQIIFCADGTWNGPGDSQSTSALGLAACRAKSFLELLTQIATAISTIP